MEAQEDQEFLHQYQVLRLFIQQAEAVAVTSDLEQQEELELDVVVVSKLE
jgi:hypothetical protein